LESDIDTNIPASTARTAGSPPPRSFAAAREKVH